MGILRVTAAIAIAGVALLAAAGDASAAPPCPGAEEPRVVLDGRGVLESVVVDSRSRLFFTDTTDGALYRLDEPGGEPVMLVDGIDGPGGLQVEPDGRILMGTGNTVAGGVTGNLAPSAGLIRVDPDTGATETWVASGLGMANGVERAADGTVFASNDFGLGIDRILPDGTVEPLWAKVLSPNGMAIDTTGRWLFAAQTFVPAVIARIEIADPSNVSDYARPGLEDIAAGFDGLESDDEDRLFVAANAGNQVMRVDRDRTFCSLGTLAQASDVARGHGDGPFPATSLYAVAFSGRILELPGAVAVAAADPPATPAPTAAPTLQFAPLRARPRSGRVRFTPRVRVAGRRIARRVTLTAPGMRPVGTRTGRRTLVRVRRDARTVRATFTYQGARRSRTVRLR